MFKLRNSSVTVVAIALTLFVFVALLGSVGTKSTSAQTDAPVWGLVSDVVPTSATLYSVYMQDENTAWLAGSDASAGETNVGRVYKIVWHDGAWHLDSTYSLRAAVHSIVAVSDDNVWAVGDDKLVAHKAANGWQEIGKDVVGLADKTNFTTIQMFGNGDEGWAAGDTQPQTEKLGLFAHLRNGVIDQLSVSPGNEAPISSLHFADGGGWAVGGGAISHFTADDPNFPSWNSEPGPTCQGGYGCGVDLLAVRTLNSDEAWAVGYFSFLTAVPTPISGVIYHRINGQWQKVPVGLSGWGNSLNGLSFSKDGVGVAVGSYVTDLGGTGFPLVIRYGADGEWHNQHLPSLPNQWLDAVSQFDATHALAVGGQGLILSYGYGIGSPPPTPAPTTIPTVLPSTFVSDPNDPSVTYFPVIGHTLSGAFRDYWNAHGGLDQFGYPITEQFQDTSPDDGKVYTVQYFERARFELHPENNPPYKVLLGLLGRVVTQGRSGEAPFLAAKPQATAGSAYFPATEHNLAPEFAQYWWGHGGLPVYGYPISEAFTEISPSDGKPYLVQYFERNRLEYHPELPEGSRVSLGLLGVQILKDMGWLP